MKAGIGIKTRKIYNSGNELQLEELINDYEQMITKTHTFYYAFKHQWFIENKANGFEVHDISLGGLIMRIQSSLDRLIDYKNKKIQNIPELEENPLQLIQKKEMITKWHDMVTPNVL